MTTRRTSRRKTKRRKTVKAPRRNATAPAPQTSDKEKIALLTRELSGASRELSESLERETATSKILGIISSISSSPSDLELVFETILAGCAGAPAGQRAASARADQ